VIVLDIEFFPCHDAQRPAVVVVVVVSRIYTEKNKKEASGYLCPPSRFVTKENKREREQMKIMRS
jgi:hypothetical protein